MSWRMAFPTIWTPTFIWWYSRELIEFLCRLVFNGKQRSLLKFLQQPSCHSSMPPWHHFPVPFPPAAIHVLPSCSRSTAVPGSLSTQQMSCWPLMAGLCTTPRSPSRPASRKLPQVRSIDGEWWNIWYTVECRYNAVQYCQILHKQLHELR